GFLEDVLKRIAGFVEHQEDMKSKVIGALAYPVFLAIAGFLVLNVLMIFFVPKFGKMFDRLREKGELPALTQYLMSFSEFIRSWQGILAVIAAIAGFAWFVHWTRNAGREWADRLKIKIPMFGSVFLSLALSRFCRILGTMLHNGIPILKAL